MFRRKRQAEKKAQAPDRNGIVMLTGTVTAIEDTDGYLTKVTVEDKGTAKHGYSSISADELKLIYRIGSHASVPVLKIEENR